MAITTEPTLTTYPLAQRLQAIASDCLHLFTAGTRQLRRPDLAALGDFTITGTFTDLAGVVSATIWARDTATGTLHAAAHARADNPAHNLAVAYIRSRILHFRSGSLLWTGTPAGEPLAYTALGAYPYRLEPVYRLSGAPNWILTAPGLDRQWPQFASIYTACSTIAESIEQPTRARRP